MKRTLSALAAAGALGIAGVAGVALLPAGAATTSGTTTEEDSGSFLADRVQRVRDALAGLVEDGTITEDQADDVAETLGSSDARGGHGLRMLALGSAAEALGLDEDALREQLVDGATLAEVAEAQGVPTAELVDALVAAAGERIDQAVADGDLDEERAADLRADLEGRVTTAVEEGLPMGGPGHGPGGHRGMAGLTDEGTSDDDATTDDATAQTSAWRA
ncbi:hypothetical protein [Georgenia muralis]|uniref:Uncharacterized protein n=1 Tax=Georgenia muralis TaxID=154117 RepID=A0A3N4ZTU9_9MICO|nr:hypothetical protein [Georgenia muralis]RPF28868.1 hypothetical protein EDD32_3416 [Georgenia muralis]